VPLRIILQPVHAIHSPCHTVQYTHHLSTMVLASAQLPFPTSTESRIVPSHPPRQDLSRCAKLQRLPL